MTELARWLRRIGTATLGPLALLSPPAWADTIYNVSVKNIGIQGQQLYVIIDRDLTGSCSGRILYLLFSSGNVDQVMSLLVTAKTTGSVLSRLDYHFDNTCQVDLAQL